MPTYEYKCSTCNHLFEEFQSMTDAPIGRCPRCGNSVKRLIGGGLGVIFKGSGFYTTDNKKSASGSSSEKSEDASRSSESKSEAKSKEDKSSKDKSTTTKT